jgi:hypothetical protein
VIILPLIAYNFFYSGASVSGLIGNKFYTDGIASRPFLVSSFVQWILIHNAYMIVSTGVLFYLLFVASVICLLLFSDSDEGGYRGLVAVMSFSLVLYVLFAAYHTTLWNFTDSSGRQIDVLVGPLIICGILSLRGGILDKKPLLIAAAITSLATMFLPTVPSYINAGNALYILYPYTLWQKSYQPYIAYLSKSLFQNETFLVNILLVLIPFAIIIVLLKYRTSICALLVFSILFFCLLPVPTLQHYMTAQSRGYAKELSGFFTIGDWLALHSAPVDTVAYDTRDDGIIYGGKLKEPPYNFYAIPEVRYKNPPEVVDVSGGIDDVKSTYLITSRTLLLHSVEDVVYMERYENGSITNITFNLYRLKNLSIT